MEASENYALVSAFQLSVVISEEVHVEAASSVRRAWKWAKELALTVLRMGFLSFLFLPLILSAPLAWIGWMKEERWYRILLWTLCHAGPTFIKLGQWMATRRDLFPEELVDLLSQLHWRAPAHSWQRTRAQLAAAYGRMADSVFTHIEPEPVASGAIAQVHRARVRLSDGREVEVAVKVRHPGTEEAVARDLRILRWTCALLGRLGSLAWMQLDENIERFGANMRAQVFDFFSFSFFFFVNL